MSRLTLTAAAMLAAALLTGCAVSGREPPDASRAGRSRSSMVPKPPGFDGGEAAATSAGPLAAPLPASAAPPPIPDFSPPPTTGVDANAPSPAAPVPAPSTISSASGGLGLRLLDVSGGRARPIRGDRVPLGHPVRFQVRTPQAGRLVIIDVDATGRQTPLFPAAGPGHCPADLSQPLPAGRTLVVPAPCQGLQTEARSPGRGRILALLIGAPGVSAGEALAAGHRAASRSSFVDPPTQPGPAAGADLLDELRRRGIPFLIEEHAYEIR